MRHLDKILDLIGEAALCREAWDEVLVLSEEWLGAAAAQYAVFRSNPEPSFYAKTPRLPEIDTGVEEVALESEPVRWTLENPRWRRFVDYDFSSESEMSRSAFYAHNANFDVRYRLGARLIDRPGVHKAIVWLWPERAGHVDLDAIRKLEMIHSGLRVAAAVQETLGNGGHALADVIHAMSDAAFVLNAEGEIVVANEAAEECLWQRTAIRSDGVVIGGVSDLNQSALECLVRCPPKEALLTRGLDQFPLIARSVVLPTATRFLELPSQCILLTVRDPQHHARIFDLLCQHYRLTAAESDVVSMLVSGCNLREIASRRGTGYETARSQIKSILIKTGARGQLDLVRFFSNSF